MSLIDSHALRGFARTGLRGLPTEVSQAAVVRVQVLILMVVGWLRGRPAWRWIRAAWLAGFRKPQAARRVDSISSMTRTYSRTTSEGLQEPTPVSLLHRT